MKVRWLHASLFCLTASALACGSTSRMSFDPAEPQPGRTEVDWMSMDPGVSPGDDFYSYANGGWLRDTPIPEDRPLVGATQTLQEFTDARIQSIIEEASLRPGSKPGDFYRSVMDEATLEAKGLAPVKPWMMAIADTSSHEQLAVEMGRLARYDIGGLFALDIGRDDKEPEAIIASVRQSGLGLPNRDMYLKQEEPLASVRTSYREYLAKLLTLAGESDAEARAAAVVAFETELARAHWPLADTRDAAKTYNKWSLADFETNAPGFPWRAYVASLDMARQSAYLALHPSAFTGEARAFAATPLPVLKDYLTLRMLNNYARFLSSPFEEARFSFRSRVLNGATERPPRARFAVTLVNQCLGDTVGRIYVARHFSPRARAEAEAMVRRVIAAMDERLARLEWMAPETKAKAREKLARVRVKIGYPKRWRDDSALEVKPDDLVGNVARASAWEYRRRLDRLGKPADPEEWLSPATAVNAFANLTANELIFPAAVLQPPFFDPDGDPAFNHGAIGATMGHELSHLFDDQGRKFDATGRLSETWTPGDVERFNALTGRLVEQYNAYEPLPGQRIQGAVTLGENLADLSGLAVAYDAYQWTLRGRPAPVIQGTTGEQRFFLGYAQARRIKYREPALRSQLLSAPHAPGRERVLTLRNLDAWYDVYGVAPGQTLYLPPEGRVRIW